MKKNPNKYLSVKQIRGFEQALKNKVFKLVFCFIYIAKSGVKVY